MRDYISILFVCPFECDSLKRSGKKSHLFQRLHTCWKSKQVKLLWFIIHDGGRKIKKHFYSSWKQIHQADDWSVFRVKRNFFLPVLKEDGDKNVLTKYFKYFFSTFRYQHSFSTAQKDLILHQRLRSERCVLSDEWDRLLIWWDFCFRTKENNFNLISLARVHFTGCRKICDCWRNDSRWQSGY